MFKRVALFGLAAACASADEERGKETLRGTSRGGKRRRQQLIITYHNPTASVYLTCTPQITESNMRTAVVSASTLFCASAVQAFAPSTGLSSARQSALLARRGKGLSIEGSNNKLNKPKSISSESSGGTTTRANWLETSIGSISELPKEKNKVNLVETDVPALVDGNTNPRGAVSVVNYEDTTYCFSAACSKCQVPMTKSSVLEPSDETGSDPRIQCDLCSTTYNMKTGEVVEKAGGKMLGFLFGAMEEKPLPTYALGEQSGKVYVSIPK